MSDLSESVDNGTVRILELRRRRGYVLRSCEAPHISSGHLWKALLCNCRSGNASTVLECAVWSACGWQISPDKKG